MYSIFKTIPQELKVFCWVTWIIILFTLCVGCQKPETKEIPELKIGHAPHDHHAPLYIAAMNPDIFSKNAGAYLKEVVFGKEYFLMSGEHPIAKVFIDSSTGGNRLIRTLDEQHNDIAFGGVPAMLSFIDQGSEMEILLPVMSEGAGLVIHKDINISNWDEFVQYVRNKPEPVKIGYKTAVSNQNLIFEAALKEVGLSYSKYDTEFTAETEVHLVNLFGPKNLIPALQNNIIDGFVVNQPFVAMAEYKGVGRMVASLSDLPPIGKWKNSPCCALAGNKKYVDDHPEVVEKLMTLLLRANQFIKDNPEKSAEQIAKWLGIESEVEKLSLPTIKYTTEYDNDWHQGVHFWVESMIAAGKINKNVKTAYEQKALNTKIYNMQAFERAQKEK